MTDIIELTQRMREAAENATRGEWIKENGDGWEAICCDDDQANGNFIIAKFLGPDKARNREFVQAVQPQNIRTLCDAIAQRDAQNSELRAQIAALTADNQNYSELLQYHIDRQAKAEAQLAELAKPEPATDEANHCASVLEYIGQFESEDIDSDTVDLRFEIDGVDTGSDVSITEYATRSAKVIRGLLARAAPPAPVDYFSRLVSEARLRADKAMRKFPQPNYVLNKVAEESGEVIKAVIHYTEGREDWLSVEGELIDNLAMLIRLVKEGDQVIGFTPPDEIIKAAGGSVADE